MCLPTLLSPRLSLPCVPPGCPSDASFPAALGPVVAALVVSGPAVTGTRPAPPCRERGTFVVRPRTFAKGWRTVWGGRWCQVLHGRWALRGVNTLVSCETGPQPLPPPGSLAGGGGGSRRPDRSLLHLWGISDVATASSRDNNPLSRCHGRLSRARASFRICAPTLAPRVPAVPAHPRPCPYPAPAPPAWLVHNRGALVSLPGAGLHRSCRASVLCADSGLWAVFSAASPLPSLGCVLHPSFLLPRPNARTPLSLSPRLWAALPVPHTGRPGPSSWLSLTRSVRRAFAVPRGLVGSGL